MKHWNSTPRQRNLTLVLRRPVEIADSKADKGLPGGRTPRRRMTRSGQAATSTEALSAPEPQSKRSTAATDFVEPLEHSSLRLRIIARDAVSIRLRPFSLAR